MIAALLLTLCQSLVLYGASRNISFTLNDKKALIVNQLNEIRNTTQPTPPPSSVHIDYGTNGSRNVTIYASESFRIGVSASGEIERTYVVTLTFLEALINIIDLIRDASIVTAITSFIVCIAIILGPRKSSKPLMPSL